MGPSPDDVASPSSADTPASVRKVKTAFLFYQGDQLSKIRAELGLSMGDAMTQVRTIRLSRYNE